MMETTMTHQQYSAVDKGVSAFQHIAFRRNTNSLISSEDDQDDDVFTLPIRKDIHYIPPTKLSLHDAMKHCPIHCELQLQTLRNQDGPDLKYPHMIPWLNNTGRTRCLGTSFSDSRGTRKSNFRVNKNHVRGNKPPRSPVVPPLTLNSIQQAMLMSSTMSSSSSSTPLPPLPRRQQSAEYSNAAAVTTPDTSCSCHPPPLPFRHQSAEFNDETSASTTVAPGA